MKLKTNFLNKINSLNFLDNDIKLSLFNFIASLFVFIICLVIVILNNQNHLTNFLIICLGYLPLQILTICLSLFISFSIVRKNNDNYFKLWYFYIPLISLFVEIIILPILLSLSINQPNAGSLWSTIIFASLFFASSITIFLVIYKINLKELTYVLPIEEEDKK